ncbi:sugar transferase [Dictyobacter arantiisoli]|nr:sugar transferase [Dictyobacter arantiisoli]
MNVFFASLGLLLLLLFLPLLAALIYIDAPGPIFYTQERLGYKGSTFRMYKLRSMYVRQEQTAHFAWTARHDPRVTRMGRLLRAAHLDEIPQVINILRGEMSLIGPRPEVADCATKLEALVPRYRQRLLVKPGLTGLAQVMHHYGDTLQDEETKLIYDFYYVEHQSFRLDVLILFRTMGEVLLRHGR